MKKETLKRFAPLLFLLGIVAAAAVLSGLNKGTQPGSSTAYLRAVQTGGLAKECTPDNARADALELIERLERIHPMFAPADEVPQGFAEQPPEGYEDAKAAFLAACDGVEGWDGFALAAQQFLTTLGDSHTGVLNGTKLLLQSGFLQETWRYDDGRLWLTDENGEPTPWWVTEIGGVPVEEIFAVIDRYVPAENEPSRARNYTDFSTYDGVLKLAGAEDWSITAENAQGEREIRPSDLGRVMQSPSHHVQRGLSARQEKDVLILSLSTFTINTAAQQKQIDQINRTLDEYLDAGGRKVIMDVRGNGGGGSYVWVEMWLRMGLGLSPYQMAWVRMSDELAWRDEYMGVGQIQQQMAEQAEKVPTFDQPVSAAVLSDSGTFSAAQDLCYAAAAEPNAVLIGSPSANAPDCYTDVVYLELPAGKTLIRMSTKHMTPADPNAPKDVLPVDIPVPYGGDAMEAALKYMAGK